MSLLEIMIAMIIVAIALLALLSLIGSSNRLQDDSRERTIAYNAARRMIEEMRSNAVAEVYRRYNSITADDVPGVCPGNVFLVDSLPGGPYTKTIGLAIPRPNCQGIIIFPEVMVTATDWRLTESPADPMLARELGMPKDLNRDGDVTDANLNGDSGAVYNILPVKVEVQWTVPGGRTNKVQVVTLMTPR